MSDPINAVTMSPEQKLQFLEDQISQVRSGELGWMLCPYCGTENIPDKTGKDKEKLTCCKTFAAAVIAILDRIDKREAMDFMENVADRTHSANIAKKFVN